MYSLSICIWYYLGIINKLITCYEWFYLDICNSIIMSLKHHIQNIPYCCQSPFWIINIKNYVLIMIIKIYSNISHKLLLKFLTSQWNGSKDKVSHKQETRQMEKNKERELQNCTTWHTIFEERWPRVEDTFLSCFH